ncbi:hypothetical protein DFP72DRAFT_511294 [Ephemerocybe angulata]|uniref:Uncharacterized protein n=1 Tax=Ephemerocybe angulata TaxID=980116 RepID=A0A8H6HRN5_9AGAR|nr:hypothetical protein DFP72DRAFT_511294 [Tulosesus angulatus]
MSKIIVEDSSPSLKYSGNGDWQFDSTVHSTWDDGATVTFAFHGTNAMVYGTIPEGDVKADEQVLISVTLDGGSPAQISRKCKSTSVINELWWDSGALSDADHTFTITYHFKSDIAFELDRIEYTGSQQTSAAPDTETRTSTTVVTQTSLFTSTGTSVAGPGSTVTAVTTSTSISILTSTVLFGTSTTSSGSRESSTNSSKVGESTVSAPSGGGSQTVTATQYIKTDGVPDPSASASTTNSASKGSNVGAIAGGVAGGLVFLFFLLLFLFCVRRRRKGMASSTDGFGRNVGGHVEGTPRIIVTSWQSLLIDCGSGEPKPNPSLSPYNVIELRSEGSTYSSAPSHYPLAQTKAPPLPLHIPAPNTQPLPRGRPRAESDAISSSEDTATTGDRTASTSQYPREKRGMGSSEYRSSTQPSEGGMTFANSDFTGGRRSHLMSGRGTVGTYGSGLRLSEEVDPPPAYHGL